MFLTKVTCMSHETAESRYMQRANAVVAVLLSCDRDFISLGGVWVADEQVLDMFGCQLPVCAMNYETIGELVRDGDNGLLFSSPQQLAQQLRQLLTGFPAAPSPELKHMQRVHARSKGLQWDAAWTRNVLPVVRRALDDRT